MLSRGAGKLSTRKRMQPGNTFSAQKQAYLKDYLKAIATGVVKEKHRPEMQTVQHREGARSGPILRLVR